MIDLTKKPTQKRALKILNWVELYLGANTVRAISRTEIYREFGNTSRQPGKVLKTLFLEVADTYYNMNTGSCIKYRRNKQGIEWIKNQLGITKFIPMLSPEQEHQLDTGEIEYTDKSQRLWSHFQFIEKTTRNPLLKSKGYNWDYDIEVAAPTLLYQLSQRQYQQQWLLDNQTRKLRRPPNLTLTYIEQYINDRSGLRTQIANDCLVSESDVKTTITALFQGGCLTTYRDSKLFQDLGSDHRKVRALSEDQFLRGLRRDIKKMWIPLRGQMPVRYQTDKNGISKRVAMRGRDKSGVYLGIERQVADVIRGYLKKTHNRHLWIHDGWCCSKRIYSDELVSEVRRKTGYLIRLSEKVIGN
jgi:hypothetical protein